VPIEHHTAALNCLRSLTTFLTTVVRAATATEGPRNRPIVPAHPFRPVLTVWRPPRCDVPGCRSRWTSIVLNGDSISVKATPPRGRPRAELLTATAPSRKSAFIGEGLWCQLLVVIVYSSTMIEIGPELSGSDGILDPIKHSAVQAITGMNGGRQDHRFGNPLVAGSSPARPTSEAISQDQVRSVMRGARRRPVWVSRAADSGLMSTHCRENPWTCR
jgi:hypothetical protein